MQWNTVFGTTQMNSALQLTLPIHPTSCTTMRSSKSIDSSFCLIVGLSSSSESANYGYYNINDGFAWSKWWFAWNKSELILILVNIYDLTSHPRAANITPPTTDNLWTKLGAPFLKFEGLAAPQPGQSMNYYCHPHGWRSFKELQNAGKAGLAFADTKVISPLYY